MRKLVAEQFAQTERRVNAGRCRAGRINMGRGHNQYPHGEWEGDEYDGEYSASEHLDHGDEVALDVEAFASNDTELDESELSHARTHSNAVVGGSFPSACGLMVKTRNCLLLMTTLYSIHAGMHT